MHISISTQQAGDDAKIRLWRVPEGGLQEMMTEPESILQGRCEPPPLPVSLLFSHNAQRKSVGITGVVTPRRPHGKDLLHQVPSSGQRTAGVLILRLHHQTVELGR